ncbi:MAG: carbonic anhydrase [Spirochaetaceae bacterium]|jgi:carbonic anhydrase|nr:carbonic anhydrase [Spirochaetaceae bacterium]
MKKLLKLLNHNHLWAQTVKVSNPDFFKNQAEVQNPEYLWIGCIDSRVPPDQILNMPPGNILVHRNIANLIKTDDPNCMSVVQFAIVELKVKHIIICGHSDCGGIKAAVENNQDGSLGQWLLPVRNFLKTYGDKLESLSIANVEKQVQNLCESTIVQDAWKNGQELEIHGWFYHVGEGRIMDLNMDIDSFSSYDDLFYGMEKQNFG